MNTTHRSERRRDTSNVGAEPQGKVLIADDDTLVSKALAKVLGARGYTVTCVDDGWKASEALLVGDFDLLVTDILMPGNSSLEMLQRKEVRGLHIPVIVITGHPTVETAVGALRLAVVDYFVKPIDPEAFLAGVERAIARGRALRTVSQMETRLGRVTTLLESVRSTLELPGMPLLALEQPASAPSAEDSLRARLSGDEYASLSPRERDVLLHVGNGATAQTAASSLGISVSTVRNHLKSVYRKLGVSSQVGLVRKVLS